VAAGDRRTDGPPHAVDLHAGDGGETGEQPFHAGRARPDDGEVVDGAAAETLQHHHLNDVGPGDAECAGHLPESAWTVRQGHPYPQQHASPPVDRRHGGVVWCPSACLRGVSRPLRRRVPAVKAVFITPAWARCAVRPG
jgi:hypothetical protein